MANPLIDRDLTLDQIAAQVDKLKPQGFQLLSLSMYGDPFDPRFSAVWDKRPGPFWVAPLGFTVDDLKKDAKKHKANNFYPRLVTATGQGANTRMSAVFEELKPPQ